MSVTAETYIVISLMFAVFAAVAAVGTSVVLGAGFERLRAGFDLIKRQSGFFADSIYKLDQRTQKLDEETSKLKAGVYAMDGRVNRVEKQTAFMADAVNSIERHILNGTAGEPVPAAPVKMTDSVMDLPTFPVHAPKEAPLAGLFRDFPEEAPVSSDGGEDHETLLMKGEEEKERDPENHGGITTLLSRYFTGEMSGSGKDVVYH